MNFITIVQFFFDQLLNCLKTLLTLVIDVFFDKTVNGDDEHFITAGDYTCVSEEVKIGAEAIWNYLLSHTNWQALLDWIRSMASDLEGSHENASLHVQKGNVVLPKLSRGVFSQIDGCHKVVKEMILEELTRYNLTAHLPLPLLNFSTKF